MVRLFIGIFFLFLSAASGQAQGPGQVYKLTIRPAALPAPVFKYRLLPDIHDQTPGNAAMLYYRSYSTEWEGWRRKPGLQDRIKDALQMPVKDLPRKDLGWIVEYNQFKELDLAARREYCDWGMTARVKTEGIGMLLPDMQGFRGFGDVLALRTRFHLADGHFSKAAYSLQTGFALGKDVANAPLLINALVGVAVSTVQAGQVDEWIQTPGSPNLYWALSEMPRPFIDPHKPLQGETLWLYAEVPLLRNLDKMQLSPQQSQQLTDGIVRLMRMEDNSKTGGEEKMALMTLALKFYPEATRTLIAAGRQPEEVEAMPMIQVYLIRALQQYFELQDNLFKWYTLPYHEAIPGLNKANGEIKAARQRLDAMPFIDFLPAITKVYTAYARLDRRIAALRCIEAIRLYASMHEGKLPGTLGDITEVPVPIDPMLAKPFEYKVSGDKATLSAPAPEGTVSANALTYELTMTQ